MWQNMVDAAANYPYGVSEFNEAGFSELPSIIVKPPRVKESSVSFECTLYDSLDIKDQGETSATLFIGKIEAIHVHEQLIDDNNRIDPKLINAVGRLGGVSYCTLGEIMQKPVPVLNKK
jgi:flavin reductase (DIM6/NTAB) family NADH-FMN oxidoreductase RutF